MEQSILIRMEKVSKVYGEEAGRPTVTAVSEVDLEIKEGEFVMIHGPSGSGKTTLLNIMGLLDVATSGKYFFDGTGVDELSENNKVAIRSQRIGHIFQLFHLIPIYTSLENVLMPILPYSSNVMGKYRIRANELLTRVGLDGRFEHMPGQLSGGESQRVAIARSLINNPQVLLADEPTGNLDKVTGGEIVGLLKQLNRELGLTIVMVTHDETNFPAATRILQMSDGKMI